MAVLHAAIASSGVGGVRRVRLAVWYVGSGSCVSECLVDVLDAASIIRCGGGASGAVRRL